MDVVGFVASVAQILELSGTIILNVYHYWEDVRGSTSCIANLSKEIGVSLYVLGRLGQLVSRDSSLSEEVLETKVQSIRTTLEELDHSVKPEKFRGLRRLRWPIDKRKIEGFIDQLHKHNIQFLMLLNIEQSQIMRLASGSISEVREGLEKLHRANKTEKTSKILNWLSPVDAQDDQFEAYALHVAGTGDWIFREEEYMEWESGAYSFLWIHGGMGIGKTILASSIIEKLSLLNQESSTGLAYFYCNGNVFEKHDTRNILGSLIKQLLRGLPARAYSEQITLLESLYDSEAYKGRNAGRPLLETLIKTLHRIFALFEDIYIVIDGLDEIATGREQLLTMLVEISQSQSTNFHILVISRPEKDIEIAVFSKPQLEIRGDMNKEDISAYIEAEFSKGLLSKIQSDLKLLIKETLLAQSGGMFRWVQCQLDYIKNLKRDKDRREALQKLPPGLPKTYDRELSRIVGSDVKIAQKALKWLVCCQRPLLLHELHVAIAIVPEEPFDVEEMLDNDELILDILGSLVRKNSHTSTIEVAHFSVTEYLTAPERKSSDWFIDMEDGHADLLTCCLTYLSYPKEENARNNLGPQSELEDAFMEYATFIWPLHAKHVEHDRRSTALIASFLQTPESDNYKFWSEMWEERFDPNLRVSLPASQTGLYYAALFSLPNVVHLLLERHPTARATSGGVALVAATRDGNEDVVRLLLKPDVDLTARTKLGWTALHRAAYNGHRDVIEMLLDWGFDVNSKDFEGWTALHISVSEGYTDVAQLLVERGADVNAKLAENEWGPLHLAAQHGRMEIAEILLPSGAQVDQLDNSSSRLTALHVAALHEQAIMIWHLLDHQTNASSDITTDTTAISGSSRREIPIKLSSESENLRDTRHYEGSLEKALIHLVAMFPDDFVFKETLGDFYFRNKLYLKALITYWGSPQQSYDATDISSLTHPYSCVVCSETANGQPTYITGYRFKCTLCWGFNICGNCYGADTFAHVHERSEFIYIPGDWHPPKEFDPDVIRCSFPPMVKLQTLPEGRPSFQRQ